MPSMNRAALGAIQRLATRVCAALLISATFGCGGSMSIAQRHEAARPAVAELQAGHFDEAEVKANAAIDRDGRNAEARVVRALVIYVRTTSRFYEATIGAVRAHEHEGTKALRRAIEVAEKGLADVEEDLEVAAKDDRVAVELCLSCWEYDWDRSGKVDGSDRLLFQIERDESGNELASDDPRRRPTFRFDIGDVYWARAMIAFQRAALDLALAYRLEDLEAATRGNHQSFTIHLQEKSRVKDARKRILEGLDHSDRSRAEYLAEKDDDREWVPNPHQASHPMPLPVDDALYDTWKNVVQDVRRLVASEDGLDLAELARFAGDKGHGVRGFLDLGLLLSDPHDVTIDVATLEQAKKNPERALKMVFGDAYVDEMKPSPLPKRLRRMETEIGHGDDTWQRKLRYLLWLN